MTSRTMTGRPRVFGAAYSVYVRIVRLALAEKGVDYELVPIDIFAPEGPPPDYAARHPFRRIPAFEHDGFSLYETGAIVRYIDEAFDGPSLQPTGLHARARCNQLVGIADAYAYRSLVWGIYVERVEKPRRGEIADETTIAAARAEAQLCLTAIADLMGTGPWLAGQELSLADLYLAPMADYALRAREGRELLARHKRLATWWEAIAARPSMAATHPD